MTKSRPTFSLTLEALGDDLRPPEIRLRQLLKVMLRGFRMKCIAVCQVHPKQNPPAIGDVCGPEHPTGASGKTAIDPSRSANQSAPTEKGAS